MAHSVYFQRYAWPERLFAHYTGSPEMIVVVPAFNEPALLNAIKSLQACYPPGCHVLIIVIVNEPENASEEVRRQNQRSMEELRALRALNYEVLYSHQVLPGKKAGVGLARKIGMDEAARIFDLANKNGIIVCFDADCTCLPNYLQAIYAFYQTQGNNLGLVFYKHPLETENSEAIINYELYLRYYINALRLAGYPFAVHTLGSCITVRSAAYQKQGGMNTRKAGEDFYFIHKMTPLGGIGEINDTAVVPSARISERVPFGTGHAIHKYLQHTDPAYPVYHPQTYMDLKTLIRQLDEVYASKDFARLQLSGALNAFLMQEDFKRVIEEAYGHSTDYRSFLKRLYYWLDGFKVLKYIHFVRDHHYRPVPLDEAARWLCRYYPEIEFTENRKEILSRIREFDRKTTFYIR